MASATPSRAESPARWALPLRWRLVLLVGAAIALLSLAAVATSYLVVRASLLNDLRESLRTDARRVAALYGSGEPGSANENLTGPTGGVVITLYGVGGNFLATSATPGQDFANAIPLEVVQAAGSGLLDWQGEHQGRELLAALAPFGVGIAAVVSDTTFIAGALNQIARVLTALGVVLVAASGVVAWAVAGSVLQPVRGLARQAARLGPDRLQPIHYTGADDELGLLSNALNRLIVRLRAAMEGQKQFLLETSHELRTPLTSLQGFLDRAVRRAGPEVRAELADARRIAGNMTRLVEDLLQLGRGETVPELDLHLVDPVEDVLEHVAAEFPGVSLSGSPGSLLLGDPGKLRQLVRNLTANAVRAAGAEQVTLSAAEAGEEMRIVVADSGPGIPDDQQERIFDKFYKGAGGGAGLGLAIARQIAEQHGGEISLKSRPGSTEFVIMLPLLDAGS